MANFEQDKQKGRRGKERGSLRTKKCRGDTKCDGGTSVVRETCDMVSWVR